MAAAPNWDQLLQQSEDLAYRESEGFPRVERDLLQVEEASQKLRAKAARIDSSGETLAATRLLAQEGLDARRLTQGLQEFELRPTYEDVFQVETSTVDEYLQQVHEMTVISAIQEAQRETNASFEDYMTDCMEAEWAQDKRRLFDTVLPASGGVSTPARSPAGFAQGFGLAGPSPGGSALGRVLTGAAEAGGVELSGRAAKYSQVVAKLNESVASGQAFDAIGQFAAACADEAGSGEGGVSMQRVWQLLQSVAGDAGPGAGARRTQALLRGGRQHLERGHAAYLRTVIQANRTQASLGGNPSKLGQINAFLRVKNRDVGGPLDFDTPGGVDTSWQRIFYCLRSGFGAEAVQIAQSAKEVAAPRLGGRGLAGHLQEWLEAGQLAPAAASALALECERLLRDRSVRSKQPFYKYRCALHVLLSGDRRAAQQLLRETSGLFPTIEDFMWFQLGLVRAPRGAGEPASPSAHHLHTATYVDSYTLAELQAYLQQYPATHYSQNGKEPLLYVLVLLLSLQFRGAVAFLAGDASIADYRVDAVHLGIALDADQLLQAGGEGGAGREVEVAELIHRYGRGFAARDPGRAVQYYLLAARGAGDTLQHKGRLLRELLTESKAYGYLLGSGGARGEGGALAQFVGDAAERRALLAEVGYACQGAGQSEEAVELFMAAGAPAAALHLLTQHLSDLLSPALDDPAADEEAEAVIRRGNAAAAALHSTTEQEEQAQLEAFAHLKTIRLLLQAERRKEYASALQLLAELPFIPAEMHRLHICTATAKALQPAVAERLPAILVAAAAALAAQRQVGQLRTLLAYASAIPLRVPQQVYRQLNMLYNSITS